MIKGKPCAQTGNAPVPACEFVAQNRFMMPNYLISIESMRPKAAIAGTVEGSARIEVSNSDATDLTDRLLRHLAVSLCADGGYLYLMRDGSLKIAASYGFSVEVLDWNTMQSAEQAARRAIGDQEIVLVDASGGDRSVGGSRLYIPVELEEGKAGVVHLWGRPKKARFCHRKTGRKNLDQSVAEMVVDSWIAFACRYHILDQRVPA